MTYTTFVCIESNCLVKNTFQAHFRLLKGHFKFLVGQSTAKRIRHNVFVLHLFSMVLKLIYTMVLSHLRHKVIQGHFWLFLLHCKAFFFYFY